MKGLAFKAKITLSVLGLSIVFMSYQNCGSAHFGMITQGSEVGKGGPVEPPICVNPGESVENGIVSAISYIAKTSPVVVNYGANLKTTSFAPGSPDVELISNPAYLSQFAAYDQDFTLGFVLKTGELVKDIHGKKLDEYFSLRNEGRIGASVEGNYQFAVISDDGSMFYTADSNGHYSVNVNNEGTHASKMVCATTTVKIKKGDKVPFKLNYYQGPRTRISLMLLWRLNPTNLNDTSLCGYSENGGFAEGSPKFAELAAKGWQLVPARNFYLPSGISNPCVE